MKRTVYQLFLTDLELRHPGLTRFLAGACCEAASVCLDQHKPPPTPFTIEDNQVLKDATVFWNEPDERTRRAHANKIDATESGAYACALAATDAIRGLVAIQRAETRTGADWYMAPSGQPVRDLEGAIRLEVSGTDGPERDVWYRVGLKEGQVRRGDSNLPAMVCIVGFKVQKLVMQDVNMP